MVSGAFYGAKYLLYFFLTVFYLQRLTKIDEDRLKKKKQVETTTIHLK